MAAHSQKGTLQADGSIRSEPLMDVSHVANSVAHIASLPNEVALLEMIIMCVFIGGLVARNRLDTLFSGPLGCRSSDEVKSVNLPRNLQS